MAKFPFNDLHSFKDYVGFVHLCAPDMFPAREGLADDEQWSLCLAFEGLRQGIAQVEEEKGPLPNFPLCRALINQALKHYEAGELREGANALGEVKQLLAGIKRPERSY